MSDYDIHFDRRKFVIEALPSAVTVTQPIVVAGTIETRADGQQSSYAAEAISLVVKPKAAVSAALTGSAVEKPSAKK